jgi:ribosomal protein L37AE/L43A
MKKFIRTIEDFTCEHCGFEIKGSGYTNHCLQCLWSKHVDVNPGDRAEECRGMMEPVDLVKRGELFYVVHKCEKCGFERLNKAEKGDNFEKLIEISSSL